MYKLNPLGAEFGVQRLSDGAFIPDDEANADWRAYLEWVDAGNTAYAADYEPGEDAQAKPAPAAGKRKAP
jgi:hypothetical protein